MGNVTARVSIVGAGSIGTTVAYSLALRCPALDILLLNRGERKAWARAFDIAQCAPELAGCAVRSGNFESCAGSDVVVLTVGVLPREDGTRSDVLADNVEIYRSIVPRLAETSPGAVFVVVTNPVDAMAYAAWKLAGSPRDRVIGSGTALDSLRLRTFIGELRGLDPARLHIDVVGEHGDTMVPLWSRAEYGERPLDSVLSEAGPPLDTAARAALVERTRRAGWEIRRAGEHSCYGVAFSVTRIVEEVLAPSDLRLSVSGLFQGECGISGVFMSLPTRLGPDGIIARDVPPMDPGELGALRHSGQALETQMSAVDKLIR